MRRKLRPYCSIPSTDAMKAQTPIEQHRVVYAALGELMVRDIHALPLTTRVD
jgi:stress-induced morphogen